MSAARIEETAARWLLRREEPGWSEADQAALDAWLDESMAHKAAFWRLEHGWREADRIGALGEAAEMPARVARMDWRAWWKPVAIAASLILTIGIGSYASWPWLNSPAEHPAYAAANAVSTPVGGHKVINLPDGSRVELNTASLVRSEVGADRREVWLDRGEAYFEVAHAEGRPFVVHAGPRTITVLGTKFSVRRDGDRVTVSVREGRVRVEDATPHGSGRATIIAAGDVAIAEGPATLIAANSPTRVENALSWRDGTLVFDQSTLAEAAAEFNRYNRRQIVIRDPEAASIRIGGTFQASNVDAFARLLRDAYGLDVEVRSDRVTISS